MENKIKVFISSSCDKRYDDIRKNLKDKIKSTNLADVYVFENEPASTLTAQEHYKFALADCDVCIFLIDNYDGVPDGVLEEVDTAKKHNIKSLYYFCDEKTKEKTALEKGLIGASFTKIKTVHSFNDLCEKSAQELIDDIVTIYHYYCKGNLISTLSKEYKEMYSQISINGIENTPDPSIPKIVLKNVDKCKEYIIKFVSGIKTPNIDKEIKTSEIDEWGLQFLEVLLENKSIKQFNTSMLLNCLKEQQDKEYNKLVSIRWNAIEYYFLGNIEKSIEILNEALKFAKNTNQPIWVIKDILIDLRNLNSKFDEISSRYQESEAQKDLTNSSEELYYPILDRILESLNEKYVDGLYENETKSPYTITIGNSFYPYGELLASSYIISTYNGSLTHILMLYSRIKDLLFYMMSKYDDWPFKLNLFKMVVFNGNNKKIKNLKNSCPEILNCLSDKDALSIMQFCENHPISYERLNSLLLAFGSVGYYLDDKSFNKYQKELFLEIDNWLKNDKKAINIGFSIFKCFEGIYLRLSQDSIANICNKFINKKYYYFYMDMFKMFFKSVDISKMNDKIASEFLKNICTIFEDKKGLEQLKYEPNFLYVFRYQNKELTSDLDKKIKKYLNKFYKNEYLLETTDNEEEDIPAQIERYLNMIKNNNETQGQNRVYYGRSILPIETIHSILLHSEYDNYDEKLLEDIVVTVVNTIINSEESVSEKIHAVSLLIYIAVKFSNVFYNCDEFYNSIYEKKDNIEISKVPFFDTNIDILSLKISMQFLFILIGKEDIAYQNLLELLPYVSNDIANSLVVTTAIIKYLEIDSSIILPDKIECIIMQYTLQWLQSDSTDIRWNATRILFALIRNPINENILNNKLINLIDTDNVYIKNLIVNNMFEIKGISDSTKEYILSKCKNDYNFVVRFVCEEQIKNQKQ